MQIRGWKQDACKHLSNRLPSLPLRVALSGLVAHAVPHTRPVCQDYDVCRYLSETPSYDMMPGDRVVEDMYRHRHGKITSSREWAAPARCKAQRRVRAKDLAWRYVRGFLKFQLCAMQGIFYRNIIALVACPATTQESFGRLLALSMIEESRTYSSTRACRVF